MERDREEKRAREKRQKEFEGFVFWPENKFAGRMDGWKEGRMGKEALSSDE